MLTVKFKLPALTLTPPEEDENDVPLYDNMVYKSFNISIATSALMLHMVPTPGQNWQVRAIPCHVYSK